MRLSVVIPILNQHDMAHATLCEIVKNVKGRVEFVLLDNGSETPFKDYVYDHPIDTNGCTFIFERNIKSIGVYPTFKQGMELATGDVVAFLHSDVVIWEQDWDYRVDFEFYKNPKLGMIGFIGSNEIDSAGGRGLGTTSNFQGKALLRSMNEKWELKSWKGSEASVHGKHSDGYSRAAVVDGCVMILRREAWDKIGHRDNFPPHHFYDRLISTQMLEAGYEVGVLGVAFDHFSGQTVNTQKEYQRMAWNWLVDNDYEDNVYPDFDDAHNYDEDIYKLAEHMWLEEYRSKGLIPTRV